MRYRWIQFVCIVLCARSLAGAMMGGTTDFELDNVEQFGEDVVVADAVFRGVYVGIVRMIQRVNDDDSGAPTTTVMVRVKHRANDSSTPNHMWHVEHDPITGVDCAAVNKHFAPFGITKQPNYTTYCSGVSPDYCEIGDISTKTTLTSIGKDVVSWYNVPMLPVVGPWTVIGHSVNIHGGYKSKVRQACGNIALNTKMTPARVVSVNVKISQPVLDIETVREARIRIAEELGLAVSKIQTAGGLYDTGTNCTTIKFLVFGYGTYDEKILLQIQNGKRSIGALSPVGCTINGQIIQKADSRKTCANNDGKKEEKAKTDENAVEDDYIYADAVFKGVYEGIVRMKQKVTSSQNGFPVTNVMVRLKHPANDTTTINHMWHVEHDPIANISCSPVNKHFAPFGITKQLNYTTYCSGNTPDYCEIGDISTKTTLTSVGKNVIKYYNVPLLPVVGPYTVIGHSVNVHGGFKSKIRRACANIVLNTRMTRAQIVNIPVKFPESLNLKDLVDARIIMSKELGVPLSKIHTAERLDMITKGCTNMTFLVFGRGKACPIALEKLQNGRINIGTLSPKGCGYFTDAGTTAAPGRDKAFLTAVEKLQNGKVNIRTLSLKGYVTSTNAGTIVSPGLGLLLILPSVAMFCEHLH
uniref:uncharacterized protein LOC120328880 isoform X1 n=1 Tax=Styela clava TaxID=7725 RepID=UPI00193A2D7F|nr:uncharacterized protein LOC120328880 isoform X1 [Styela clava]